MSGFVMRTDGLTRSFGTVRAVDQLTIDVRRGEIFGFLGPNGAGKTATIHLLLALLQPTDGKAEVLGLDTHHRAAEVRERSSALLEVLLARYDLDLLLVLCLAGLLVVDLGLIAWARQSFQGSRLITR